MPIAFNLIQTNTYKDIVHIFLDKRWQAGQKITQVTPWHFSCWFLSAKPKLLFCIQQLINTGNNPSEISAADCFLLSKTSFLRSAASYKISPRHLKKLTGTSWMSATSALSEGAFYKIKKSPPWNIQSFWGHGDCNPISLKPKAGRASHLAALPDNFKGKILLQFDFLSFFLTRIYHIKFSKQFLKVTKYH